MKKDELIEKKKVALLYKKYLLQAKMVEMMGMNHDNSHDNSIGTHPDYHNNSHDNTVSAIVFVPKKSI